MSLVTACPACGTRFRVRAEQLSARGGRVRCGHCGQAFDALASLGEAATPARQPAGVPDAAAESSRLAPQSPPPADAAETPRAAMGSSREAVPQPVPPLPAADLVIAPPEDVDAFSPPPPAAGHRLRILLLVLLVLLGLGQLAYHLRTPIATALPATRPLLEEACMLLGCRVELPHHVERLGIEDSDLRQKAGRDDAYMLTATLSNRAPYPMAYPLLELTLTDINDTPLLRRRLTPEEYLPAGHPVDAGIAGGSDLHLRVHFSAGEITAAGYRVYVTY